MDVYVNKEVFRVNNDEFMPSVNHEYNNLKILQNLGLYERLISLLQELTLLFNDKVNITITNPTHGGYIPIELKDHYSNVFLCNTKENQIQNIVHNVLTRNIKNIFTSDDFIDSKVMLLLDFTIKEDFILRNKPILVCLNRREMNKIVSLYENVYTLSNTDFLVCIPSGYYSSFYREFHYFISGNKLDYDNLINLNIMVKNAGELFEKMLTENLPYIDRWTILDTGSTDDTIAIINKVLVGKKKGNLYQEPFINFRDSRNRCLELAGKSCKYNIMLDDTYVLKGDLRHFLDITRGDQFSDSFSLYIKSHDNEYSSNRITKTKSGLKYMFKIHEVITDKNNINVCIPLHVSHIHDYRADYMEKRTMDRKLDDLRLLFEEVEEDPSNPRHLYYIAQTYNLLDRHEEAFEYFMKRAAHPNEGFIQEKIDALFEGARIAQYKLNKPWEECEKLYMASWKLDETRPEPMYFIGIHYKLQGDNEKAYYYIKKAYDIGYPEHTQHSLKPTLSYHYVPKFLTELCYMYDNYTLGLEAISLFFSKNKETDESYHTMVSWKQIFNILQGHKPMKELPVIPEKPWFCFVADGGFEKWTGRDILTKGVGGSETFIIEMAKYMQKNGKYNVIVFCKCNEEDNFDGVIYRNLTEFSRFISENIVEHCMVSRYTEYIPLCIRSHVQNLYLILHDLLLPETIIPISPKLKHIFCLTDWHTQYFLSYFPIFKDITKTFSYGIDQSKFTECKKKKHKFIYSSYPNRGLLYLLKVWPRIVSKYPEATLHIYCDVESNWANSMYRDHMIEVKRLLYNFISVESLNIKYHGWVDKNTLSESWRTADVWFYPCTYAETFCLTALEAAMSKTLVVTNDLAALINTVGDRGEVIKGDPSTEDWQDRALEKLFDVLESPRKNELIERNYNWAMQLSWESRANELIEYLR